MRMRALLLLASLALLVPAASASETTYLYKAKLVQAAPGKLLEVIDLYKASLAEYKNVRANRPLGAAKAQDDQHVSLRHSFANHHMRVSGPEMSASIPTPAR